MIFLDKNKNKGILNLIFRSNYLIVLVGLILLSVTWFLWQSSVKTSLDELSTKMNSIATAYSNNIDTRANSIEFSLNELASKPFPSTPLNEQQWDTSAQYYVDTLPGIEDIVLVDGNIFVDRVIPVNSEDYIVGEKLNSNINSPGKTNILVPVFNGFIIEGFLLGRIDVFEFILSVDFEQKSSVMVQLYNDADLVITSENWTDSNTDISASKSIIFKDQTYYFVLKPTEEMISESISSSSIILIFGVSLSLLVSIIWFFTNASGKRLESLVAEKTKELSYLSYHDRLTGLHNRRFFEEEILQIDHQKNYPLTLILSDLNGLKIINDSFGHLVGDQALIRTVDVLEKIFDTRSLVCRLGGDEFAIVLSQSEKSDFIHKMDLVREQINSIELEGISLSISMGYSMKEDNKKTFNVLYTEAEDMMYREKLSQMPSNRRSTIDAIIETLNQKDKLSEVHSKRVALLSERIARILGWNTNEVGEIKTAGLLHDIGKIAISNEILNSSGKLSRFEYEEIKKHPETGYRILNSVTSMRGIAEIVYCHHERIDGKGYPRGITKKDIPLQSRVIAVADALDAMLYDRSYRKKLTKDEAKQELIDNSGTQFCSDIVKVVVENFEKVLEL